MTQKMAAMDEFIRTIDETAKRLNISYICGFSKTDVGGANPSGGYSEYQHNIADLNYAASFIVNKEGAKDWIVAAILREMAGLEIVHDSPKPATNTKQ